MTHSIAAGPMGIELNFVRVAREHRVTIAEARVHLGSVVALDCRELLQSQLDLTFSDDAV